MSKLLAAPLLSLLLLAPAAHAQAAKQKKSASPEEAIRAADQAWLATVNAKDMERFLSFCAGDGSILAPNAPIATGRDAIRQLFAGYFALPNLRVRWQPTKAGVARSGELGYTSGTYEMSFNDPSGKTVNDRGKYTTVWKRGRDGSWKVFLDNFNSDLPAAQ